MKKTAPLFQKWLYYGLATIFSGVLLGVMADISMDLVANIAASSAITEVGAMILTGEATAGIMQTVTQQLGLGLLLSVLLITVPPMAGAFFNGVMAGFSPYSVFDRWNNSGGADNRPPAMGGGRDSVSYNTSYNQQGSNYQNDHNSSNNRFITSTSSPYGIKHNNEPIDTIKNSSQRGLAGRNLSAAQERNNTNHTKKEGS